MARNCPWPEPGQPSKESSDGTDDASGGPLLLALILVALVIVLVAAWCVRHEAVVGVCPDLRLA